VKSEAHWQSHLHSTQHLLRSQRAKDAASARSVGTKRKAEEDPDQAEDIEGDEAGDAEGRKRARGDDGIAIREQHADSEDQELPIDDIERKRRDSEAMPPPPLPRSTATQTQQGPPSTLSSANIQDHSTVPADEEDEELLAFQRDLAELDSQPAALSAFEAEATISAAPMTAEELAAQASEEASTQGRGRRDVEIEAEREDAERVLEEELEEMQGLEARVKRLRDRREALRKAEENSSVDDGGGEDMNNGDDGLRTMVLNGDIKANDDGSDDNDDWAFGGPS